MAEIRLTGVNKVYPGGTHAVHDVDLHIADGEFMIMVGPSGCAKSTILRMIAGLETPTTGTIEIGGRVVNDVAPKDRDIAMVFQSYALYPHMTVRENMAFGLKLRRMPQGEIDQRVAEAARILGLEQLLDRLPKAMSGGQRQRVAMGRAIVREPQAFLMDEPLSNLDAKLRVQMRTEIAKLHQRLSTTTVYVTHDQVEAMTLGQRICILRKGVVQQVDTPFQVYQNPANVFVGGFIGSPGMNFMDGHLLIHEGMLHLQLGERVLPLPASVSSRLPATTDLHGRGVIVGIRPEHMQLTADHDPLGLPVQVELTEAMGSEVYAYFTASVSSPDLTALSDTQAASATFVARLAPGADTRGGERISLRPDLDEVHLFDPASMLTLLAPADEREVRARQVGAAVELAGGTASHPGSVVASPSPAHVLQATAHAPAQQQQPVIHLYQTIVGHDGAPLAGPVGTLGEQDPTRIASVFDQPVAAPVALEPLMPAADGSVATTASAHPRPTFASQVGAGSTLDPALTTAPGITMPAPGASPATMQGDDDRAHAPTPTPTSDDQVAPTGDAANAPARAPRGFAPRTIGPVEPTVVASAPDARPAETARLTETDLDAAIDAIDAVGAAPAASVEPAPAADDARQGHHSPLARLRPHGDAESLGSSFRDALERIRSKHPVLTGETRSHPSVLPPPMLLGSPQLDLNGLPTDAMTNDAIRHEPDAQAPHLNDRADDSTET